MQRSAQPIVLREPRVRRLARVLWRSFLILPIALMCVFFFVWAPPADRLWWMSATFILVGVSCIIYPIQIFRKYDAVASMDVEGLTVFVRGAFGLPEPRKFPWAALRAIEIIHRPRAGFFSRNRAKLALSDGEHSAEIVLNRMTPRIFEHFTEALRQYWPDFDTPRQDQLARRNGLDGGVK